MNGESLSYKTPALVRTSDCLELRVSALLHFKEEEGVCMQRSVISQMSVAIFDPIYSTPSVVEMQRLAYAGHGDTDETNLATVSKSWS